ncbi:hypothetical protein Vi05172_g6607 [Venturia inaequalis]|uniref:BTB domain-containing protein n=1 Tax=Venturia inaequalis TaxID=5025 RepID=A0A8H3UPM4_VENIN|nr:hypothetical protein EG327_008689 [Venturia inaequalis]RDI83302.1 hypothetical protein Vi05172_g6607 [Venturia inaequalis]
MSKPIIASPFSDAARELDWSKLITVEVGGTEPEVSSQTVNIDYGVTRTFSVYEDLFRAQSPFFEAALGRDFIEAKDRVVKLPEHTPEAFDVYLRWTYSYRIFIPGMIGCTDSGNDMKTVNCTETERNVFSIICRAYILGDVLQDSQFKDALMDALIEQTKECASWPTEEVKYVYGNTMSDAPIRCLLVSMAGTGCVGRSWLGQRGGDFYDEADRKYSTIDFLCDVMRIADERLRGVVNNLRWREETCRFHEHGPRECYKAKLGID